MEFLCAGAFFSKWWNTDSNERSRSGNSENDVRMRVIEAMWLYKKKHNLDADINDDVDESHHNSVEVNNNDLSIKTPRNQLYL